MSGNFRFEARGIPAIIGAVATRKSRALQREKDSLAQQVQNWEKTLTLLQKHAEGDPRIPVLVDKIAEARIGDLGISRGPVPGIPQGRAPVPVRTGPTPAPGQPITPSFGPLRTTVRQFQQGQQVAETRQAIEARGVSRQARAVRVGETKAEVAATKPSEGLRNRYKTVGSQMVKKAQEIAGLRSLVPAVEPGILGTGFGGNAATIENAQRSVNIAQKEMDELQTQYNNLRTFATNNKKTLDLNEWDVFQAGNPGAAQNIANSQQNPAQVTSQAQYDALQVGAWYVHPTRGVIQKTAGQAAPAVNRAGV